MTKRRKSGKDGNDKKRLKKKEEINGMNKKKRKNAKKRGKTQRRGKADKEKLKRKEAQVTKGHTNSF